MVNSRDDRFPNLPKLGPHLLLTLDVPKLPHVHLIVLLAITALRNRRTLGSTFQRELPLLAYYQLIQKVILGGITTEGIRLTSLCTASGCSLMRLFFFIYFVPSINNSTLILIMDQDPLLGTCLAAQARSSQCISLAPRALPRPEGRHTGRSEADPISATLVGPYPRCTAPGRCSPAGGCSGKFNTVEFKTMHTCTWQRHEAVRARSMT